jgi:transcriptional regulator with XRE-family HTH domain
MAPRAFITRRRIELGRFLRQRRSRVTPESVGLRSAGRRHVRGLRRDEVAWLAGIGVSWYTMLEQGRVENVGTRTLDAVATALGLTTGERTHLHALASRSFEELDVDETPPSAEILNFVRSFPLGGAFVHSSYGELIAWNAWADEFYRFSKSAQTPPNLLDVMFRDPAIRAQFVDPDWADIVRRMTGHVRLRYGDAGTERFERVLEGLLEHAEFRAIWNERPIVSPPSEDGLLDHPVRGRLETNVIAFTAPSSPTYSIILTIEAPRSSSQHVYVPPPAAPPVNGDRAWRRADLGRFLRYRRERMRPEDVGIVPIGRRHAKGLRRDEVAHIAGIGVSWYTMLEQGRVEHVRTKTLNAIAAALRLSARERAYLRSLAAQSFDELRDTTTEPRRELIEFARSYPLGRAFLHDARFDLVAWNDGAEELFRFSTWPRPNVLQTIACTGDLRSRLVVPTWHQTLVRLLEYLRWSSAASGEVAGDLLVAELRSACPELATIWATERSVAAPPNDEMVVRSARGFERARFAVLVPSACPTYTLVTMTAIDQDGDVVARGAGI